VILLLFYISFLKKIDVKHNVVDLYKKKLFTVSNEEDMFGSVNSIQDL